MAVKWICLPCVVNHKEEQKEREEDREKKKKNKEIGTILGMRRPKVRELILCVILNKLILFQSTW